MKLEKAFILVAGTIAGIILILYIAVNNIVKSSNTTVEISSLDSIVINKQLPIEYEHFFSNIKDLNLDNTTFSKTRNPISEFNYKSNYTIILYKISKGTQSLKNLVKEEFSGASPASGIPYYDLLDDQRKTSNDLFKIEYECGHQMEPTDIFFTLFGDKTSVIKKNDTIAYYSSYLENFSIRYSKDGNVDFYGENINPSLVRKLLAEIMFLKRKNSIYLIILTEKKVGVPASSEVLLNLLDNLK